MQRVSINKVSPASYKAMDGLEDFVSASKLKPSYKELIKIRASQINGCAYCIDMHTKDARALGEPESKIYAISAWRESPLFNEEERAILAFTDEITNISNHGVSDEVYQNLAKFFDDESIAEIIMINVTINSWNRICVSIHLRHNNSFDLSAN